MSDSQPLIHHIGQKWYEMQLNELRAYGFDEPLIELDLLYLLYSEAKIQPSGQWNNNQHLHLFGDEPAIPGIYTPVYNTSHSYAFIEIEKDVLCAFKEREPEGDEEIPECAIIIKKPDSASTKSVLATCHKISQHQSITDLWIQEVKCYNLPEPCVFNMSKNARSLTLIHCILPTQTLIDLIQQISECNTMLKVHLNLICFSNISPLMLNNKIPLKIVDVAKTIKSPEQSQMVCEHISNLAHDQFNALSTNCHSQEILMLVQDSDMDIGNLNDPFFQQFNNLMIINLSGNILTGIFQHFLPDPSPGLPLLMFFDLSFTGLNKEDLQHLIHLIKKQKLPKLQVLALMEKERYEMNAELGMLIEACVKNQHGRLELNVSSRNSSEEFKEICEQYCEDTHVDLMIDDNEERDSEDDLTVDEIDWMIQDTDENQKKGDSDLTMDEINWLISESFGDESLTTAVTVETIEKEGSGEVLEDEANKKQNDPYHGSDIPFQTKSDHTDREHGNKLSPNELSCMEEDTEMKEYLGIQELIEPQSLVQLPDTTDHELGQIEGDLTLEEINWLIAESLGSEAPSVENGTKHKE